MTLRYPGVDPLGEEMFYIVTAKIVCYLNQGAA